LSFTWLAGKTEESWGEGEESGIFKKFCPPFPSSPPASGGEILRDNQCLILDFLSEANFDGLVKSLKIRLFAIPEKAGIPYGFSRNKSPGLRFSPE
jgi:hypothetical protein